MKRGWVGVLLAAACAAGQIAHGQAPEAGAAFVAPGPVEPLRPHVMAALAGITRDAVAAHVRFLASAALEGRGLGARGLDAAAEYAAATLAIAGLEPVPQAEGGIPAEPYFHPVPIREITRRGGHVLVERRRGDALESWTFAHGVDAVLPRLLPRVISAPAVYAEYGIRTASPSRDDYRDLDVRGRIVVVEDGVPKGAEWSRPALAGRWASPHTDDRHEAKRALAESLGARALVVIEREGFAAAAAASAAAPAFFAPFDAGEDPSSHVPVVRVSGRAGRILLAGGAAPAGEPGGDVPRPLPGTVVSIAASGTERAIVSRNVIGMIRGSDPRLRDEAVVVGAHLDHLGVRDGAVYPGADDNASGVASLLEMAKAFAAAPARPKRTVVVAFWTGEEEGHLGSEHYAAHPAWPLARTSAYVNLDMIGHPWKAEEIAALVKEARLEHGAAFLAAVKPADFVELGVADSAPHLEPVLARAARACGLALHLDRTNGRSGGSDYRAFARRGVPFVRVFGNFFDGYHEPVDTADRLDAEQVAKVARLAFASAWLLADR
ncbi:MAG TPA: M20/M25/M40 family metallo-hydrolase [Vicinamibacterales bacterium]|nr:M20/M25/M40 family metallo-hydrolase [Vicinamibacterales bacterium]HPW19738.1 M20/M25/M40 family metallo-hydrolase [Vicinamibacterales bacterium]